jgi:hypothetical protein
MAPFPYPAHQTGRADLPASGFPTEFTFTSGSRRARPVCRGALRCQRTQPVRVAWRELAVMFNALLPQSPLTQSLEPRLHSRPLDVLERHPVHARRSPWMRPSPSPWRVGVRIEPFEACSGFTRVAAGRIAQPPEAAFVAWLQRSQTARQLPDPSTSIRVEPSSTGETRLQGAHGDTLLITFIDGELSCRAEELGIGI